MRYDEPAARIILYACPLAWPLAAFRLELGRPHCWSYRWLTYQTSQYSQTCVKHAFLAMSPKPWGCEVPRECYSGRWGGRAGGAPSKRHDAAFLLWSKHLRRFEGHASCCLRSWTILMQNPGLRACPGKAVQSINCLGARDAKLLFRWFESLGHISARVHRLGRPWPQRPRPSAVKTPPAAARRSAAGVARTSEWKACAVSGCFSKIGTPANGQLPFGSKKSCPILGQTWADPFVLRLRTPENAR